MLLVLDIGLMATAFPFDPIIICPMELLFKPWCLNPFFTSWS